MRYTHYLAPATGGKWPRRIWCVDCVSRTVRVNDNPVVEREELVTWNVAELVEASERYTLRRIITGTLAVTFWQHLHTALKQPSCTWLLSYQCGRVWPLLDVWTMLEDRRLRIVGTDPYEAPDSPERMRDIRRGMRDPLATTSGAQRHRSIEQRQGMLIVADPPCIMSARLNSCETRVTWVDSRNYSVKPDRNTQPGTDTAQFLSNWMTRYRALCQELKLGSLQTTTGSQALHGWRTGYYHPGVLAGGPPEVTAVEESAYYGGRCEAFFIGKLERKIWHLDIRSCYAYQCVVHDLPVRIREVHQNVRHQDAVRLVRDYKCIALVDLETSEPAYPYRRVALTGGSTVNNAAVPVSYTQGAGTDIIFPVGRFTTALAGPELADAIYYGRVERWHVLAVYDSAPILQQFARDVYSARCDYEDTGDRAMEGVCKALLVSIVGKFGQRDRRWSHVPDSWTDIMYGEWYGSNDRGEPARYRSLGGTIQREDILGLSRESVPAVAAWITSSARSYLLTHIRVAGWEHVFYCDTDSLFVDEQGYDALDSAGLIQHGKLGALYAKRINSVVEFRGIKYYVENGNVVCSGLPRDKIEDAGDGAHYWYHPHAGESASQHRRPIAERVLRPYQRSSAYTHGTVRADGVVEPIHLQEW